MIAQALVTIVIFGPVIAGAVWAWRDAAKIHRRGVEDRRAIGEAYVARSRRR